MAMIARILYLKAERVWRLTSGTLFKHTQIENETGRNKGVDEQGQAGCAITET